MQGGAFPSLMVQIQGYQEITTWVPIVGVQKDWGLFQRQERMVFWLWCGVGLPGS